MLTSSHMKIKWLVFNACLSFGIPGMYLLYGQKGGNPMKQPSSEEVRNHQNTKNDSQEQRDKVKKRQDVEPQAENWNPRDLPKPDDKQQSKS